MKAELTKDGYLKISPDTPAESIALQYMFIAEQDPDEFLKKIVIDSNLEDDPLKYKRKTKGFQG